MDCIIRDLYTPNSYCFAFKWIYLHSRHCKISLFLFRVIRQKCFRAMLRFQPLHLHRVQLVGLPLSWPHPRPLGTKCLHLRSKLNHPCGLSSWILILPHLLASPGQPPPSFLWGCVCCVSWSQPSTKGKGVCL